MARLRKRKPDYGRYNVFDKTLVGKLYKAATIILCIVLFGTVVYGFITMNPYVGLFVPFVCIWAIFMLVRLLSDLQRRGIEDGEHGNDLDMDSDYYDIERRNTIMEHQKIAMQREKEDQKAERSRKEERFPSERRGRVVSLSWDAEPDDAKDAGRTKKSKVDPLDADTGHQASPEEAALLPPKHLKYKGLD